MKILVNLASLALKCTTGMSESTVGLVADQFSDTSQRMSKALQAASERAWKTLEVSLAGTSWLDKAKGAMASREEQVLRGQITAFLQNSLLTELEEQGPAFRQTCLKELQRAKKAKLIPWGDLHIAEAAAEAERFARYEDPKQVIAAELQSLMAVADDLTQAGYPHLGRFIGLSPAPGPYPLLVMAVRYFFRREIENDPRLSTTWQFQQLDGITQAQEAGFANLHDAILQHGAKMEQLLEDVLEVVTETRDDVRAIKEELQQLRELLATQRQAPAPVAGPTLQQTLELYQAVLQAAQSAGTTPTAPVTLPSVDSSPVPPEDWGAVEDLVTRCRALPKEQQRKLPALFRVVGKLKAAASDDQARSRLFPHLVSPRANATETLADAQPIPPLPETPSVAPAPDIAPKSPKLRRVQGKPISPIFQAKTENSDGEDGVIQPTGDAGTVPATQATTSRKPGKRPISKLFDGPNPS